jgi:hypothetical protein
LTDDHRCRGRTRYRIRLALVASLGALGGAVTPFLVFPQYRGHPWSVGTLTVLGAIVALSIYQAIPGPWRGRF